MWQCLHARCLFVVSHQTSLSQPSPDPVRLSSSSITCRSTSLRRAVSLSWVAVAQKVVVVINVTSMLRCPAGHAAAP